MKKNIAKERAGYKRLIALFDSKATELRPQIEKMNKQLYHCLNMKEIYESVLQATYKKRKNVKR